MTEPVLTGTPVTIEPGKTYVITSPELVSEADAARWGATLQSACPDSRFILLDGGMTIALHQGPCQGAAGCTSPATPSCLCPTCQGIATDAARDAEQELG